MRWGARIASGVRDQRGGADALSEAIWAAPLRRGRCCDEEEGEVELVVDDEVEEACRCWRRAVLQWRQMVLVIGRRGVVSDIVDCCEAFTLFANKMIQMTLRFTCRDFQNP